MTNRKYVPLNQYLDARDSAEESVTLSFAELEQILGFRLPPTAMVPSYWAHGLVARNWFLGGFEARLNRHEQSVTFQRMRRAASESP
ncbi:MAG: DUF7662 domain-containing protein [Dehalococcoidia bacterium]